MITAQMEGGIGFRLGAALYGAITLKDGKVEQTNFNSYQVLRIDEMPKVDVHIVQSRSMPPPLSGCPASLKLCIAVAEAFGTYVAQVAEVTVARNGDIKVDRVVCAVDCGTPINPDVITAQMEGGIGFGLGRWRHAHSSASSDTNLLANSDRLQRLICQQSQRARKVTDNTPALYRHRLPRQVAEPYFFVSARREKTPEPKHHRGQINGLRRSGRCG